MAMDGRVRVEEEQVQFKQRDIGFHNQMPSKSKNEGPITVGPVNDPVEQPEESASTS